ncbi:MAG: MMPL family transporter [Gemmataceae bacterium]|nr:MMPL family transporter [Gemmataceae bacterium]
MFKLLGRLAASHPWGICTAWLVTGLLLTLLAPTWDSRTQDDDIRFLPERCPSVGGYQLLQQAFPQDVFASRLVFALERSERPLTQADFALVGNLVDELEKLRRDAPELKIGKMVSCRDGIVGGRLTSADRHCTLIQVPLDTPFLALQTRNAVNRAHAVLKKKMGEAGKDAPRLYATGSAGIGRDLTTAAGDSLDGTTLATVLLVIVVLLLVYRAPLLALVPLVTIAVSVWVSLSFLALATLLPGVHLVNISKIFAIVILYGAGTDYCLFLIARYREQLENGKDGPEAISGSVRAVGGALAASAGTVMIGLGLMGFAEFAKVRYAGPAIALSLGVGLLASLTLTPALLRLLGKRVFWPQGAPLPRNPLVRRLGGDERGFWSWVSHKVAARPVLIWAVAVGTLLPLAWLGLQVTPNYRATGELGPESNSLRGLTAIQRHFTAGETGPCTVLLESTTNWDSVEGRAQIEHLSLGFAALDGVAEVRSLTQPLGKPTALLFHRPVGGGLFEMVEQAKRAAREHYLAELPPASDEAKRYVTRLDVVLKSDPFDPASAATLRLLQTWLNEELPRSQLVPGVRAEVYGVTANAHDLAAVTEADRVRVNALILAGILLILLVLVRRPWFAAYLLVTVLFSYYATLGATMIAGTLWSGRPLVEVDWRVPFFLFTILVAVGEDYNILLVTRAVQERKRHGAVEGMRRALARTGGTITSCGLIMAGTFATLMLGGLGTLRQIGFALAFGVLIDTFVVRPFLVPALAMLFWRDTASREEAQEEGLPVVLVSRPPPSNRAA